MNKNDIKSAIDEVKPSPYLKTRVMAKASATAVPKKKYLGLKSGVAVALCLAIIGTTVGITNSKNDSNLIPETTNAIYSSKSAVGFAMIAYAKDNGEQIKEDFLATKTPLKYNINLTDIRGKSEQEIEKLMKSSSDKIETMELPEDVVSAQQGTERLDNILLTRTEYNFFDLDIPTDVEESIKEIRVANTSKYGEMVIECPDVFYNDNGEYIYGNEQNIMVGFITGNNIVLKGERYAKTKRLNLNFGIHWQPTTEMYHLLDQKQTDGFKDVTDTITFEVEFKDNTISKSVIDITFDTNGNMFATTKAFEYK